MGCKGHMGGTGGTVIVMAAAAAVMAAVMPATLFWICVQKETCHLWILVNSQAVVGMTVMAVMAVMAVVAVVAVVVVV